MTQYILDTDTLTLLQAGNPKVSQECRACPAGDLAITVISLEEQLSGWYTALRTARRPDDLARVYQRLADTVRFLGQWTILSYTTAAIARYHQLIGLKLNIRRMDLRISAIVLVHGGTLVTRNTRDFGRVPGLILEDWAT
jgi:tRNA(fMet)-specific endonuclease VapC